MTAVPNAEVFTGALSFLDLLAEAARNHQQVTVKFNGDDAPIQVTIENCPASPRTAEQTDADTFTSAVFMAEHNFHRRLGEPRRIGLPSSPADKAGMLETIYHTVAKITGSGVPVTITCAYPALEDAQYRLTVANQRSDQPTVMNDLSRLSDVFMFAESLLKEYSAQKLAALNR